MRVKMFKQPPLAPTASAVSPCPTVIQIVEHNPSFRNIKDACFAYKCVKLVVKLALQVDRIGMQFRDKGLTQII